MANEADEGLKYKGRKANCVTRDSASNGNSQYKARALNGEQLARTSFTSSVSHSSFLQGNFFDRRKNLQNRETKTAKTSVTSEVWYYTQVRKSDPVFRKVTFF